MSDSPGPAVVARAVSKRFDLAQERPGHLKDRVLSVLRRAAEERVEPFWALRNVSLAIEPGEALGLVGRNGSGKSTLLRIIAGILTPTTGALFVRERARIGTMIELGVGFHPELTAIENVQLSAAIHGLTRPEIDALMPGIVDYSGLANFMDVPLKKFSSGMHMRLGFALAAALEPDVLLIDEVFAVGDVDFQHRCLETMRRFREHGRTILFVSHSTAAVREVCTRAVVLEAGRLVFDGTVDDGLTYYGRLMASETQTVLPGAASRGAVEPPERRPHRLAMKTAWEAIGPWAAAFLKRQGLGQDQFVLDLGCGSLPVARELLPVLPTSRYWGVDFDRTLYEAGVRVELAQAGVLSDRGHFIVNDDFDLSGCTYAFDLALAHSLAHRVGAERFGRALSAAIGHLTEHGRLFVAVPAGFEAHLAAVRAAAARAGLSCEPVADADHPTHETVYAIIRTPVSPRTEAQA